MGLDNFAARAPSEGCTGEGLTEEDLETLREADIHLCGGILSGPTDSFRGKVYADFILKITGEDLYQEWIPPDKVKRMYEALMKCNPEEAAKGDYLYSIDESDIINLRKFFKVCAERNLGLAGW